MGSSLTANAKYFKYDYDYGKFTSDEPYDYVRLPYVERSAKSPKVLFVLDWVPSEDLHSGKLLYGESGDLLNNLLIEASRYTKQPQNFSWMAMSASACRVVGKTEQFKNYANTVFKERVESMIIRYKPDYVVAFGRTVQDYLLGNTIVEDGKGRRRYSYWLGVPVTKTISSGKQKHTTKIVSNLSLDALCRPDINAASMLGYAMRCLSPIFGKTWHVDAAEIESHKSVYIDTIEKFDKLLDYLEKQPIVSIDTETKDLSRITNKLLTIQFAVKPNIGYLVPVYHKDTPFTADELKHIIKRLRIYFEKSNQQKYQIFVNGRFDLTVMKNDCGIRYFKAPLWDVPGAEFVLDENMKALEGVIGEYYYSLANIAVQYGYTGYITAEFGKSQRAGFSSADLNDPAVRKYCTLDVVVPLAIHYQQIEKGKHIGYKHFEQVVYNEISDTIHAFSKMEHNGSDVDVKYLFFLRTENSPIEQELRRQEEMLIGTKAGQRANKLLLGNKGIPQGSLFADVSLASALQLSKPDHQQTLFFDVLKLKPLSTGKSGKGKVDKAFQLHYKDVPEVAAYTALQKAKKLRNAYVKSFINRLAEDPDFQKDHCVRATYNFLKVVTHRTSASNPNLQQVPAHSELGKLIKRLFVARKGTIYIKVDYRVHEVRGWGLISFDKAVAEVFAAAKKLRDLYRIKPTAELAERLKTEADIHVQNASYFFSVALNAVDKPLRNAVKGIIFGFIYGMGLRTMAKNINKDEDFTKTLLGNFAKRFQKAVAWSKQIKETARQKLFVEAPTHIRRNLWGYLLPNSIEDAGAVHAQMDRQAGNAPIQGMCAKFMMNAIRLLDKSIFDEVLKDKTFELHICNSVHDSLENQAGYKNIIKSLVMIEYALTEGVKQKVKERYGFDIISDLEIDFEIGATLSTCDTWDFSVFGLYDLVRDALEFQRDELKHEIDVASTLELVFSQTQDMPKWMITQCKNIKWELPVYVNSVTIARHIEKLDPEKLAKYLETKFRDGQFEYVRQFLKQYPIKSLDASTAKSTASIVRKYSDQGPVWAQYQEKALAAQWQEAAKEKQS